MTNKEKDGAGYLLSAAAYPELFRGFRIINEFQSKDEKKVILNYTEVESQGDTFRFSSTSEYKAAIVYIPISSMPVKLANILQGALKDGKAVIPIYPVTTQHIFIGDDRLEGAIFPDCFRFLPNDTKYLERIDIDIPARKEGETYKGTCGETFYRAQGIIEDFIDLKLNGPTFELFQKMNITVYRDEALKNQFIVTGATNTFDFIAIMTAISKGSVTILSPEETIKLTEPPAYKKVA
jgi:hypothetical protein